MSLPLVTVVRLEGLATQLDLTRAEAIAEAVRDWTLKREASLNRQNRLMVERALHEAADQRPIEQLLADFRRQMGESRKISARVLTDAPRPAISRDIPQTQDIRERREALGISREKLAHKAGISSASIERFETGARFKVSPTMEKLEATLAQLEAEQVVA